MCLCVCVDVWRGEGAFVCVWMGWRGKSVNNDCNREWNQLSTRTAHTRGEPVDKLWHADGIT